MVFRPTWEEFKDFNKYLVHIESQGRSHMYSVHRYCWDALVEQLDHLMQNSKYFQRFLISFFLNLYRKFENGLVWILWKSSSSLAWRIVIVDRHLRYFATVSAQNLKLTATQRAKTVFWLRVCNVFQVLITRKIRFEANFSENQLKTTYFRGSPSWTGQDHPAQGVGAEEGRLQPQEGQGSGRHGHTHSHLSGSN